MTTPSADPPRLHVLGVGKRFPGVRALHRVNLEVRAGEVLALIGENGAGKSTLMKILAGVQPPDEGEIRVDGRPVRFASVQQALAAGVALIHQELNLADNLDIGANIFLGREPTRFGGLIDAGAIARDSLTFLQQVGLDLPPSTLVGKLPIGHKQLVEIAKALSVDARVLIMDEPTSSLSQRETEQLFTVIRALRGRGVGIIYISHRLGEVSELADRVTVLRDGENAGELSREEIEHERMVRLMVGRDLSRFYVRSPHQPGEPVLDVRGLRTLDHPEHALDFTLHAGEIVGMAGLVGAGRSELLETLFGMRRAAAGSIRVNGRPAIIDSARAAIDAGIALVPEDRKLQGLVVGMSIRENLSLASLRRHRRRPAGFLDQRYEVSLAAEMIERLGIRTPGDRQIVRFLSGGNQQKVVIGKWLAVGPGVLLLDEPTRGIDVGAKQEIYSLMEDLAGRGVAILFVSSEMEEILGMADRVLVLHEGRLAGEIPRGSLSEESVLRLATGNPHAAAPAPDDGRIADTARS